MTIRSLLQHVGIDLTGKDIYVGDRLVDPASSTAIGAPVKNQLAIPGLRVASTWQPPTLDDFAHATVQAFDQTLTNTGVVLIKVNDLGIHLLSTAMIKPPEDVLAITSTEGSYARADSIYEGIVRHRSGYAANADAIVYERKPVAGMRTDSIFLAGREVHRATDGRAVMMDNRHAKKVLLGTAGTKDRKVTKADVKDAVEQYIPSPKDSGRLMPWNEHVRDACMLALAYLLDLKKTQVQAAALGHRFAELVEEAAHQETAA
ncbi:hypothetical protein AB0E08_08150 [Streptomyces sp. NPDC048281]|uniref:hypothetical protein n=1 Tax=Streptomyces sp. NPDC048281 TaxID=3154715 RepID=UPI00343882B9